MKMDSRTIKTAYISISFIAALCAIVASYFHQYYLALGLIILASAILLGGSLLFSYKYRMEKAEELKKL
ncbi:hypothetical protein [Methanocella conradii]|uniref:hypothetical protein n=1 Tax=Methanocella conradii TaxID=1175444 RepID=UPI00157C6898|nr:hypothetical protein [Methanocella conradii]